MTDGHGNTKRVLYHLRTQGTGSEGIHIRGMVTAFRKQGYEVDFVWPLGEGDPTVRAGSNPYDTKKGKSMMERIVPLIPGPIFSFLEFCYNLWAYRRFSSKLGKNRYSFIYERHFFFSIASGLISKRFKIPLVVEVNELAGYERVRKNHLVGLAKRCERSLFKNATIISVVSTFLRDSIIRDYPDVNPKKIHIIPNGMEERFFKYEIDRTAVRRKLGIDDRIVFGFVGFFLHVQSWHFLEWFVSEFIDAVLDDPNIALLLVGDGPGRRRLEEIGRSKGFGDRLVFSGLVPNDQIGQYIEAMDAGVIPHTNEYRSPIKLFEYMTYGKPILAPRQEPVEAIVGEIQGQYLFEAKSGASLNNATKKMLSERGNWAEIGKRLKNLAWSRYTYEKHGGTILHLLKRYVQ